MGWLYRQVLRPFLFRQDAEAIHHRTLRGLAWAGAKETVCDALSSFFVAPALPVEAFGLRFPNPIGLAAGLDKNADALPAWQALGFGFTELGAVTWHAQTGNPAPRLFRIIPDQAIINRMGFNNDGAPAMAATLQRWRELGRWPGHPVGMNLGKSKITPLEKAPDDYAKSLRVLLPYLDFAVVNVSSPNTPNLRQLQDKAALDDIFFALNEVRGDSRFPLLVKVAPDLTFEALDEILELIVPRRIAGIIATNTTIARPSASDPVRQKIYAEAGGLSGKPLRDRSTEIIRHLYRQTKGSLPIIGVGGIFNAADAWEKITAGATLLQIYTGLIYEGPGIVNSIVTGLLARMEKEGMKTLREAVGSKV